MQKLIFLLIGGLLVLSAKAQDNWDLQKCVDYALQNNVVIKQYELGQQYNENQLNQAKMNRLPNLNAGVNQGFSFGRSLNNDNVYENFNSSSTSFNIGSNVTIYNGSILNNRIKKSGYELEASRYDLETAKDDVILNITSGFLDILFAQELLKVAEKQIDQTNKQIERSNKLAEAGKIAKGDVLQIEAQLAREEQNKVETQNQLKLAYLSLAQYMELESYHSFAIQTPVLPLIKAEISLNNAVDVFGKAIELRPEIKKAEANLKGAEVDLEIAKGYGLPTLSASASYYNQYLSTNTATMPSFADQFKDNDRKSLGLNLSIPIFNKFQVKNGVENAKLQIENSKLDVEQSKKNLRKIIEMAHTNALAAHQSYLASKKAVEAMQISFEYTDEKYNAGMVNSVEYNKAKTDLTVAESELLRAKYQFIFRSKILDFYNGIPISL